jgi:hypothetical protein
MVFQSERAVRIENVLDAAVETGPELAHMGSCSREIDSQAVSDAFVEQLISRFPG